MQVVGGYFGLELNGGQHYHQDAIRLNTARNCLEYILRAKKYKKVFIPYYTCEVLLEPFKKLGVAYEFYHLNELLDPVEQKILQGDEAFLYTNYFGLKDETVMRLASLYKSKIIIDNAQAFYSAPLKGIDTIYSARKFFGVPDGAYLYTDMMIDISEQDVSHDRMSHLLKRIDIGAEEGYIDFQINDKTLIGQPIKKMSKLTDGLLAGVDYIKAKDKRIANYKILDSKLRNKNNCQISRIPSAVPMIYPFQTNDLTLRNKLMENKVFTAMYWPNVLQWCKPKDFEFNFTKNTIFIPVDQRYSQKEMNQILNYLI